MSINNALENFSNWYQTYQINSLTKTKKRAIENQRLRERFLFDWPITRLKKLTIDEYIIGKKSKKSFCYEMEFGKYKHLALGIGGGTAAKYGLYYSQEQHCYLNAKKQELSGQELAQEFNQLKMDLIEIVEKGIALNFDDPCFDEKKTTNTFFNRPALVIKLLCGYSTNPIFAGINTARDRKIWNTLVAPNQHGGPFRQNYEITQLIQNEFPELNGDMQSFVQWDYLSFLSDHSVSSEKENNVAVSNYQKQYSRELIKAHNIIFHGAPGTGKSYLAKEIAADIVSHGKTSCYPNLSSEQQQQIEFVQFHPSYDYTDFVEGLRPVSNNDGSVGFKLTPGIFMAFIDKARTNYEDSQKSDHDLSNERIAEKLLSDFLNNIEFDAEIYQTIRGTKFSIHDTDDQHIELIIPDNPVINQLSLNTTELLKMLQSDNNFEQVKDVTEFFGKTNATQNYSYDLALYKEIKRQSSKQLKVKNISKDLKNYIFIIDEVNRGEISKIFGELFFALDPNYRGGEGSVATQYSNLHDDPNRKFYIPENVYLIGTMNDIDRSVDTFDFAMRRRFTFFEITADQSAEAMLNVESTKVIMKRLNDAIITEGKLTKDYQIGASYFQIIDNDERTTEQMNALWANKLYPLLADYFRGDRQLTDKIAILKKAYFGSIKEK